MDFLDWPTSLLTVRPYHSQNDSCCSSSNWYLMTNCPSSSSSFFRAHGSRWRHSLTKGMTKALTSGNRLHAEFEIGRMIRVDALLVGKGAYTAINKRNDSWCEKTVCSPFCSCRRWKLSGPVRFFFDCNSGGFRGGAKGAHPHKFDWLCVLFYHVLYKTA